jgi:4-diphosphocytidyl-2-C-methyl-D-erythritol kinase
MTYSSYAKVNLYLKIGSRLKSGYHNIQSVMQRIELSDNLKIEPLHEDKIIVESTNKDIENEINLAHKAALLLKKRFKVKHGVKIFIEKNIPLEAGLGGGSSNAATTLIALNKLWSLKLKEKQLIQIGSELGADVSFFVGENAALVEGIGDKVKWLKKAFSVKIVLINPGFAVSTKWAYSAFDRQKPKIKTDANIKDLIKALEKKDINAIADNIHNDFEPVIAKKYKIINEIKTNLLRNDALNATISGSGPTVFGVFNSIYEAREAFFKMQYDYPFVFLTKTL